MIRLRDLDRPFKLLATMFLIVLGAGFGTAHVYLHHTVDSADGREDLVPTFKDITLHFHGSPNATRLRAKIDGSMLKYFSASEDEDTTLDTLAPEERANHDAVRDWDARGAPEAEYWNPKTEEYARIGEILMNTGCFDCHVPDATGKKAKPKSPLDTYEGIAKFTQPDTGMDVDTLLMLSHVHLLGMGLMFLGLGAGIALTSYSARLRSALIVAGFLSVLCDIGGWWAVKYGGGGWAWLVMFGGMLMGVVFAAGTVLTLLDTWKKPAAE
ncbi:MAG: hypothetical protein M5U26_19205 [Planctomycetota bacterium]|nr:hypothetical protein [Planctomycetota bacterium]